jgi:hypothetical protein
MTKIQKTLTGISLLMITVIAFSSNIVAQARLANITTTINPIPADSTTPTTLYIPYGSINSDLDIRNAIATANLVGSGFRLEVAGFQDLYYGSPLRTDAQNPPTEAICNSAYAGPLYNISPSLATTTSFTYGLQTSRSSSSAGGTSTAGILPSGQSGLREKATGCIRLQVSVVPGATAGQTAVLTFDEDSALSVDYQENRRPGLRLYNFSVAAPTNTTTGTTNGGTTTGGTTSNTTTGTTTGGTTSTTTGGTTGTATTGTTSTTTGGTTSATTGNTTTTPRTGGNAYLTGIVIALAASGAGLLWYNTKKTIKSINLR